MCQRILGYILAGFFTFVVATVAAFVYLEWWQAILVSFFTFLFLIAVARIWVLTAVGKLGNLAKLMFESKSAVLRGAGIQVHSVHPCDPPANLIEASNQLPAAPEDEGEAEVARELHEELHNRNWFQIEATIFPVPGQKTAMTHWDIDDLRIVPIDARPFSWKDEDDGNDENEFSLHDLQIVSEGVATMPEDSKFEGPQRLQFRVGVPKNVREVKFQYYFEQFGKIPLPAGGR